MKRVKIWQAFVVLAFMVALSAACDKEEEIVLDFDITVPSDWDYYLMANQGFVYSAMRAPRDDNDSIREYVTVFKEPKEYLPGFYFEKYWTTIRAKIIASEFFVSTISDKDTAINGTTGHRMIYVEKYYYVNSLQDTFKVNNIVTRYLFFVKGNGYNMGLVTVDTTYPRIKPVFDGIMSTFQFKE
jgi:hypothetical protein